MADEKHEAGRLEPPPLDSQEACETVHLLATFAQDHWKEFLGYVRSVSTDDLDTEHGIKLASNVERLAGARRIYIRSGG